MKDNIHHKIYNKIKEASNVLLVTHDTPDGDALASVCLMIELLESLNKKYFAYCYDLPPFQFDFLPHVEKITNDKSKFNFKNFDLIIIFDCGGIKRTKLPDEIKNRNKNQVAIEFDHHLKIDDYADLGVKDSSASATTEVLYHFIKANKIKINKNIANCILTGILTDTANFVYPSTSNKTVEIASEMLTRGARMPQIMESTLRNKGLAAMKIWGKAMSRLIINPKYDFAFSILTFEDMTDDQVTEEELEGIAGFLGNLSKVKGVLFLREQEGNIIKGSFRTSDPQINVAHLAEKLGGGGHVKASGFKIQGHLIKTENNWRVI